MSLLLPYLVLLVFSIFTSVQATCISHISSSEISLDHCTTFTLINSHRQQQQPAAEPQLRFTLNGATIDTDTIKRLNTSARQFKLTDGSLLDFNIDESKKSFNLTAYRLIWSNSGDSANHELCFHYGDGDQNTAWYHSYQSQAASWPLNTSQTLPKRYFNYLHDWRTSKPEFTHILEHLFLNTDGFAVLLDHQQPLFIRKSGYNGGDPLLCFSVDRSEPYSTSNSNPTYLDLKVSLFASTNIRTVLDYVVHHSGLIPKPTETPNVGLFTVPYWKLWADLDQQTIEHRIEEFISKATAAGFTSGQIEIDEAWKRDDFSLNTEKLPNFDANLPEIHRRGFTLVAPVIPDIVRSSKQTESYFLRDSSGTKVDFVDFSNHRACEWFESVLRVLHYDIGIDGFYFDTKTLAPGFQLTDLIAAQHPNEMLTRYLQTAGRLANSTTRLAFKSQHVPMFLQIWGNGQSSAAILRSLIRSVLPVSIAGYSFLLPPKIGLKFPSEELYIRWVQATALMPRMTFHIPPWDYRTKTVELTRKFLDLHAQFEPVFTELAHKRITAGSPLIRPMWYAEPNDARSWTISDQFMLGDRYVVAPILLENVNSRDVYLPGGIWKSVYGQNLTGPGIFNQPAPLETLLYFEKLD